MKKKIVILSNVDISQTNGQGIYALKTIEALCTSEDFDFNLIVPKPRNIEVLESVKKKAIITFLPSKKDSRKIGWHLSIQFRILICLMKIGKVDAVVFSLKPTMIAPLLYCWTKSCPFFLLVEGLAVNTLRKIAQGVVRHLGMLVLNTNIKKATKVFPAYLSAQEWVDSIRDEGSILIPCGVDFNKFIVEKKKKTDVLTIGYVGSFRKVHMLEELVAAIVDKNIRVKFVGDGKVKSSLLKIVEENGLEQNVEFIGEKRQEELPLFYSGCDVMWAVCDPKHWGVPIKSFEYLACNKKVIYTEKIDFEFIEGKNFGYCLNSLDEKNLSDFLLWLENQYNEGLVSDNKEAREYIKANNNWSRFREIVLSEIECMI